MVIALLCSILALSGQASAKADAQAVTLARVNKPNEKLAYEVKAHAGIEVRGEGLQTWMPFDYDINYSFTTLVKQVKADGVVDMHYQRPSMTEIEGETGDSGPKEKVDKSNIDFLLTVSPLNEIISLKDLAPKKPKPKDSDSDSGGSDGDLPVRMFARTLDGDDQGRLAAYLQQFIGEVYRLSLNVGGFDSALDFAPKLPFDDVKPGDTWKRTVGYSPQKLQGSTEKSAVQRLDYTYTYKGIVDGTDRKVYRVSADLDLNTDLAQFFHQALHAKPEDTGLKSIKLTLKTHIDYDLDLQTKQTLKAESNSEAGFSIVGTEHPDQPIQEERIKGKTVMRLVGRA